MTGHKAVANSFTPAGGPHPVDIHVGTLVRSRRRHLGLSQTDLADAIGLTFQQVQKYEKGANRISASKLYDIAVFLKVPIEAFFRGIDDGQDQADCGAIGPERGVQDFLRTREGVEMASAFSKVRSHPLRRRVVDLVRTISDSNL